jgi:hypothetical protein
MSFPQPGMEPALGAGIRRQWRAIAAAFAMRVHPGDKL